LRSRPDAPGTVNETFLHTPGISTWVTHKIETCNHIFLPQLEVEFMCDSSIGIQVIMPKTGTSPKSTPQHQANEREAAAPPIVRQAPPPPGMGKLVDKTA
jgi:hypothetical protein